MLTMSSPPAGQHTSWNPSWRTWRCPRSFSPPWSSWPSTPSAFYVTLPVALLPYPRTSRAWRASCAAWPSCGSAPAAVRSWSCSWPPRSWACCGRWSSARVPRGACTCPMGCRCCLQQPWRWWCTPTSGTRRPWVCSCRVCSGSLWVSGGRRDQVARRTRAFLSGGRTKKGRWHERSQSSDHLQKRCSWLLCCSACK